jgi:hypothetical protein
LWIDYWMLFWVRVIVNRSISNLSLLWVISRRYLQQDKVMCPTPFPKANLALLSCTLMRLNSMHCQRIELSTPQFRWHGLVIVLDAIESFWHH